MVDMTKPEKTWNVYESVNETDALFVDTAMGFCTVEDFIESRDAYIYQAEFYPERDIAPLVGLGTYTLPMMEDLIESRK